MHIKILGFLMLFLLCTTTDMQVYGQDSRRDSLLISFSESLRNTINETINKRLEKDRIDSNNFIAVYSVKFTIGSGRSISSFVCSGGMPEKLCTVIKSAIESVPNITGFENMLPVIENKTVILPIVFDFEANPGKGISRDLSVENILDITRFPDTATDKKAGNFVYSGIPVDCILLPAFFYQTPHFRKSPYNRKNSEKKEKTNKVI